MSSSSETSSVGFIMVDIVEVESYGFIVGGQLKVGLALEPQNPHEKNGIKVVVDGFKLAIIEEPVAAVLSPMMVSKLIEVEGIVCNSFPALYQTKIPCQIRMFALLKDLPTAKATISEGVLHLSEAQFEKEKKDEKEIKDLDELSKIVGENFSKKRALKMMDPSKDVIKSDLFMHQKEGLGWIISLGEFCASSSSTDTGSLDVEKSHDISEQDEGFSLLGCKRGRLSEMDHATPKKREAGNVKVNSVGIVDKFSTDMRTKTTLVVCHSSVVATWEENLKEHTVPNKFKMYKYYGNRTEDPEELKNLNANRRWVVTGVPIQSGSIDLFPLMSFLRFFPFSVSTYWEILVLHPLSQRDQKGLSRQQIIFETISLRRMKEMGLMGLPPKLIETCSIELSKEERELYDEMEGEAKRKVQSCSNERSLMKNYYNLLTLISRLLQICSDLTLCSSDIGSSFRFHNLEV
ncbi:SNF2-related [Quillaja saponaria]|uniref:SNF2-related n=1 Tax=Quillaja saponaria TaxID=32244 RepID=A0AAD7PZN4_QUISA|nr:SNF2-related [Quillaja saponaria]